MFNFIRILFIYIFIAEFFFSFDIVFDNELNFINFFFIYYIFFILINILLNQKKYNNLNVDLFFKYLILFFKTPNFLFNYLINTLKKIYLYLVHIKYKRFYLSWLIFFKKYSNLLLIWWRPLFKKTSYFGYYRSNRSKWIK